MRCVVTGAAGFIGSHLCERLLADGHAVVGIDCFTDYYPRTVKERNLAGFRAHPQFTFIELDLSVGVPSGAVMGSEWVFHLAAMPGLARSCACPAILAASGGLAGKPLRSTLPHHSRTAIAFSIWSSLKW